MYAVITLNTKVLGKRNPHRSRNHHLSQRNGIDDITGFDGL